MTQQAKPTRPGPLLAALAALVLAAVTLPAAAQIPPDAPAHGHRHQMPTGHLLVFDSMLGVYEVEGFKDLYYEDGQYLQWRKGEWFATRRLGTDWEPLRERRVPFGLRSKYRQENRN